MPQCSSCPFGCSDAAEQAINLGCVPSIPEIMSLKRERNLNWGCHSADGDERRICAGFVVEAKELGIDYKDGELLPYKDWFEGNF